jgi:HTH-type transcriptional regulator, sugar sensing transcriptional regulator
MNYEEKLAKIGLNKAESLVYLYLLEQGLSTPSQIGKSTGIGRTNTYHVLRDLKEKSLIEEQKQNKKLAYIGSDPESLLRSMDNKRALISDILPDLRALYTTLKNKPKIRFYDGWSQVKEIYLQVLNSEIVYGLGSTKHLAMQDEKFFNNYLTLIKEKGIIFRDIMSQSSSEDSIEKIKATLRGLHEVKLLPNNYHDIPTDILIWDDSIALIVLSEPVFGTVLSNSLMSQAFKTIFDVMWDKLN